MGGKTQRVAGNVKPSSSGRIRDLLINKHGAGNIITFSALSNSPNSGLPNQNSSLKEDKVETNQPDSQPTTTILSCNDKAALIVKKVGNRECFSRVRFSEDQKQHASKSSNKSSPTVDIQDQLTKLELVDKQPEEILDKLSEKDEPCIKSEDEKSIQIQEELIDFDEIVDQVATIQENETYSKAKSLNEISAETLEDVQKLIYLMKMLVKNYKQDLSIEDWDIINSSLNRWIKLIFTSQDLSLTQSSIQTNFCATVLDFLGWLLSLARYFSKLDDGSLEDFPLNRLLLEDWKNFHSSPLCRQLVSLYFKILSVNDINTNNEIIEALAGIILDVDPKLVVGDEAIINLLDPRVEFDPDVDLPKRSIFSYVDDTKFKGLNGICNLLKSNLRVVVVTGHAILSKLIDTISSDSSARTMLDDSEDSEKVILLPPKVLMSVLTSRDAIVSALLCDYKVGDISVALDPESDSYTCTLAYLFVWDIVIKFIVGQQKQAAHLMIHCLKRLGLFQRLLDTIFMLLPPLGERDSLKFRLEADEFSGVDHDLPKCLSNFLKGSLKTAIKRPINEMELTALHVYFSMALHMPVTVRKWYNNNSSKKLTNLVNEYTVKHISQIICSLEMETIQEKCQDRESCEEAEFKLIVKARPSAKEVYAMYTRDEFKMELTVKLPVNYPLGPVQIDGGKRVGVTDQKWRSWLLQLTTFLSHQNGSILDGIDLWRRNIDKKFEGIEKCLICFSILHSNYQLPKKKCTTCTKMFHNLCLYKWFESSGNSTCPLCRNTW